MSSCRKVWLEAQDLNHGVSLVAQPGGHTLGTIAFGSRVAGQYVSVIALMSAAPQPSDAGAVGALVEMSLTQWLLVAPPVRALKPRYAGATKL